MVIEFPPPKPKDYRPENVVVMRDGNQFVAMLGSDLVQGVGGFGNTVPDALRDLAANLEHEGWQPKLR